MQKTNNQTIQTIKNNQNNLTLAKNQTPIKAEKSDMRKTESDKKEKNKAENPTSKKLGTNSKRTTFSATQQPITNPDYSSAKNIECKQNDNCQIPNYCLPGGRMCKCGPENAAYLENKPLKIGEKREDPKVYCGYVRKTQLVYFLLELLLNVGAGHFYAGNVGLGIGKLF